MAKTQPQSNPGDQADNTAQAGLSVTAPTTTPSANKVTKKTTKTKKPATRKTPAKNARKATTADNSSASNNGAPTPADQSSIAQQALAIDPQLLAAAPGVENNHAGVLDIDDTNDRAAVPVPANSAPPAVTAPVNPAPSVVPAPPSSAQPAAPISTVYRPVDFLQNPTEIYDATFAEYDNQASRDEGRLLATIHHHQMIIHRLKSHHARKMVFAKEDDHIQELCTDLVTKIPAFNPTMALSQINPDAFFRDRVYSLLANALIMQYIPPSDADSCQTLYDNCKLEARAWTLEMLDRWDDDYRREIDANAGRRTEQQSHLQLPSKGAANA